MFLVGKLQLIKRKTTDNEPQHQQDKQSILQVGRGSPRPVLQQEARVFTPLSNGEGMGVGLLASVPRPPATSEGIYSPLQRGGDGGGLFLWLWEDGARRPPSYYGLPRPAHKFFTLHITTPRPTIICATTSDIAYLCNIKTTPRRA